MAIGRSDTNTITSTAISMLSPMAGKARPSVYPINVRPAPQITPPMMLKRTNVE